jgi:hypothetical protein
MLADKVKLYLCGGFLLWLLLAEALPQVEISDRMENLLSVRQEARGHSGLNDIARLIPTPS